MTVFHRLAAILAAKYSPAKRVAAEGCRERSFAGLHYGIYLREVSAPLVKTASRVVMSIESQRDRHNPIKPTGGFADREIPPAP